LLQRLLYVRVPVFADLVEKAMNTIRTIYLLGGPRDGTRTLAAGNVALLDLVDRCSIYCHDEHGDTCEYAILGPLQNGELLAVEV
jgi:hypothetical protein